MREHSTLPSDNYFHCYEWKKFKLFLRTKSSFILACVIQGLRACLHLLHVLELHPSGMVRVDSISLLPFPAYTIVLPSADGPHTGPSGDECLKNYFFHTENFERSEGEKFSAVFITPQSTFTSKRIFCPGDHLEAKKSSWSSSDWTTAINTSANTLWTPLVAIAGV